jgi:Raf kinase inhibitor-like YbhB/YbcL family protein
MRYAHPEHAHRWAGDCPDFRAAKPPGDCPDFRAAKMGLSPSAPSACTRPNLILAAALAIAAGLIGCGCPRQESPAGAGQHPRIELASTAFAEGQPIPKKYTGEGADVSPPLSWSGLPEGTEELALICDDPDAPRGTWVHWVVYGISPAATGLPEDLGTADRTAAGLAGVIEGGSSSGNLGYGGPMPPVGDGPHRYFFRLYALDTKLAQEPGLDKQALLEAIEGHILGEGELMGTFER